MQHFAVAGAAMAVSAGLSRGSSVSAGVMAACVIGALVAGAALVVQAGANRSASTKLPSRLATTWWSFHTGLCWALVVWGVQCGVHPASLADVSPLAASSSWWMWAGGPLGVFFVVCTIAITQRIGSARFFVSLVCGQLVTSAVLDATGAFGSAVVPTGALRGCGIALVVVAAVGNTLATVQPGESTMQKWMRSRRTLPTFV